MMRREKKELLLKDNQLFEYLQYNSYYSKRHDLLYIATPKVACTSLKWWFAELVGFDQELRQVTDSGESNPELIIHDSFHKVAPAVTGLSRKEIFPLLIAESCFCFSLVRNPFKRIFSSWQSKMLLKEDLQFEAYKGFDFTEMPISNAKDIVSAFEAFLEHLDTYEAPIFKDYHWTPQVTLLKPDLISYSHLAQIEDTAELKNALMRHIGNVAPDPFSLPPKNSSLIPYSPYFISDRSALLIRKLYGEDFERFNYTTALPEGKNLTEDQLNVAIQAVHQVRGKHQRIAEIRNELYKQISQLLDIRDKNTLQITEYQQQVKTLNQTTLDYLEKNSKLQEDIVREQGRVNELSQNIEEKKCEIDCHVKEIRQYRDEIGYHKQLTAENERLLSQQKQSLRKAQQDIALQQKELLRNFEELDGVYNSSSWRLTQPLRTFNGLFHYCVLTTREKISQGSHFAWKLLPYSAEKKYAFKESLFERLPFFFKRTTVYKIWQSSRNIPEKQLVPENDHPSAESNEYVELRQGEPLVDNKVKLICFYLPQFHEIPENNLWWGDGFTEWTNVKPAQPHFEGHYQPHIPGELGYYNLQAPQVMHRQIELAKLYGVGGFCFYFYWFAGKRLLESPLLKYLLDKSLDLPFCLCWANENWSRRWDGMENEILIAQDHSPDDDLAFIEYVSRYLIDERYIRVNGKPLLVVYRPNLLPSPQDTATRWRTWCRENGIGEIYLVCTQSMEQVDPTQYGFDAAIEFPPNNFLPTDITGEVMLLDKDFSGHVYDYEEYVERNMEYHQPDYTLFRSVFPSWDNTARRKSSATVYHNSCPQLYQKWLEGAIFDTVKHRLDTDEQIVFINAWNEWAEGAYLEPDQRYGYAYLQATTNALQNNKKENERHILVVTHDCHPHGAQFLILETAKLLNRNGFHVAILALTGGPLLDDFKAIGPFLNLAETKKGTAETFLTASRKQGARSAITSTVVCGEVISKLKEAGFNVLSLIHELPGVIRDMAQEQNAQRIARFSDKIVFPAELVRSGFCQFVDLDLKKVVIRPQGVLRKNQFKENREEAYQQVCRKHNLPENCKIVLSIAYVDSRKGADLFVETAALTLKNHPNTIFIWVGHGEPDMLQATTDRIEELGLQKQVLFVGFDREPMAYYAAASVYALTSREDPFPNVVLEADEVGVPVVAFEGASGASEFVIERGGSLAKYLDTADFAQKICQLLEKNNGLSSKKSNSLQRYAVDLLHHVEALPRVSVLVPNYNYEHYIVERLESIYSQKFPLYEVIILDDASNDDSVEHITTYLIASGNEAQIIINEHNSGSVFRQWQKGLEYCTGDLIWIAEADDLADPHFLQGLAPCFKDAEIVLAYCQSKQIDEAGALLASNYLKYTEGVSDRWVNGYVREGKEEIKNALCIKNTIPNVSGVLFRREAVSEALSSIGKELFRFCVAGDWLVYLHVLLHGKIFFYKGSLNIHRRHSKSVTKATQQQRHLQEVAEAQAVARSLVPLSSEKINKAEEYLDQLGEYFNLDHKICKKIIDEANRSI